MKYAPILLLALLASTSASMANAKNQKPVADFALVDVRLGDSAEQAIEGVTEYLSLSRDDLNIETDFGGKNIEFFEYRTDDFHVEVYFDPATNSNSEELYLVGQVNISWEKNDANALKIIEEVKKYSPPSIENDHSAQGLTSSWKLCDTLNAAKDECGEGSDGINLIYSSAEGNVTMLRDFRK